MNLLLNTCYYFCILFFQVDQDNDDTSATPNLAVQDFIWKGLNQYYLWQDVPNLADDRFALSTAECFLSGYRFLKNYLMP
jgi:hypothetical protein